MNQYEDVSFSDYGPGLYDGMSFQTYQAIPAINKSSLDLFELSAMHFLNRDLSQKDTPARRVGTAIHAAILEPDKFAREYRAEPAPEEFPFALNLAEDYKAKCKELDLPVSGTKEVLKQRIIEADASVKFFDDIKIEHEKFKLLNRKDYDTSVIIAHNVRNSKAVQAILGKGKSERVLVWICPKTGAKCKCRLDWLLDDFSIAVDFKSTMLGGAHPKTFCSDGVRNNYHRQGAWYIDGIIEVAKLLGIKLEHDPLFVFGAYEKEPPYASSFPYMTKKFPLADGTLIEDPAYTYGRRENDHNLTKYLHCLKENTWEGYGDELYQFELPEWYLRRAESDVG